MNCRDIEPLLLKERDGVLAPGEQAGLDGHLADCPKCRAYRTELTAILKVYRDDAAGVAVPNVDEEWAKVRAEFSSSSRPATKKRALATVVWFAAPLAAAAALALAYLNRTTSVTPPLATNGGVVEVARAEYVEAGNAEASTMVYVDKDSGWLVVWAADTSSKSG